MLPIENFNLYESTNQIDILSRTMNLESLSYNEIYESAENQVDRIRHFPAIHPLKKVRENYHQGMGIVKIHLRENLNFMKEMIFLQKQVLQYMLQQMDVYVFQSITALLVIILRLTMEEDIKQYLDIFQNEKSRLEKR